MSVGSETQSPACLGKGSVPAGECGRQRGAVGPPGQTIAKYNLPYYLGGVDHLEEEECHA